LDNNKDFYKKVGITHTHSYTLTCTYLIHALTSTCTPTHRKGERERDLCI